ncbi:MAG: TonB-dependent receptor [Sphingomonadales bacterium RIFCSPHIGHO2_01_FULL_65_20]|uniref:TonB-dependent receptor n=1 Tax=Sphingomonas ursincola TaxID=56361 RepID=A0A7V8RCV2_9SPHN|nr:TonB-dependent receptor [Sphingomonas ursincola]MBA1374125.1 TonB-dependent receptor [Sphingomonas ursincola]MCH2237519.1 TonB-dependent receptor [Blastomonas sp.]OHC93320.1 MAG: TonB-dependent receptor [Sphingomonadales bacterium RIFCSPHIGHO2_01_FULL_65_20]
MTISKALRASSATAALAASTLFLVPAAFAQDTAAQDDSAESDVIVVTAVARGANVLDSSVSVSAIDADQIATTAPRSAAEIFRNIPGIRSESSGGEGNANIAVRGLPIASGGAKFLQLQEDGLPILEFGDITFGNSDIFLRSDLNIARVEAIRGGSASTFASNSPGGVINMISKTGKGQDGGTIQATLGLDYDEKRFDFDYGGALADDLYFHMGGFVRQGEGPRDIGYDGNRGGQFKINITKEFTGGFIRFYGKYLDDRAVAYLPNPVQVTGTNANPNYRNVPGFDISGDSLHSRFFRSALSLNGNNQPQRYDITAGQRPLVKAFGFEGEFEVADGWTVTNRFRFSDVSGSFASPFPGSVDTAANTATALAGAGSRLVFANGLQAGQNVPGNALVASVVLFNTRLNSLDNITNDLRITGDFDIGSGKATLTAGFYKSRQDINTDWLWTSHLLEVRGGGNAALIDVVAANGQRRSDGGTVAYSASFFGNCCRRSYDLQYDTNAPFASLSLEFDKLTLDGSIRYDFGDASGRTFGSDLGGGRVGITSFDFNRNGAISPAEAQTATIPLNAPALVDYSYDYFSYSLGVNYRVSNDLALFARYSKGGRANADRILFNNDNVNFVTGDIRSEGIAVDFVKQAEAGIKYRSGGLALYATGFYAETEETNFEATSRQTFDRQFKAHGIELEASYRTGGFTFSAGGTYTDAEISRDRINPGNQGNKPRRQADFIYQLSGQYEEDMFTLGANMVGTTDSFAQDNNLLVLPGFAQVNAFVAVRPFDRVQLSLNANNLFDTRGFTEAEEGAIPANGIVRARSINGRTISATLRYDF